MSHGLGVDGCRAGWFAVRLDEAGGRFGLYANIRALALAQRDAPKILIDMPIGLPASAPRRCDREARRLLRQRASSIFPVPCRAALSAPDYASACAVNVGVLGVKLSRQSWNILPKIRELDDWLQASGERHWVEAHPELAFWALNGGEAMAHGKKTAAGLRERLHVLDRCWPGASALYAEARAAYPKTPLADDDIADALALAVTASLAGGDLRRVPQTPEFDATGLPMQIVFAPLGTLQTSSLAPWGEG